MVSCGEGQVMQLVTSSMFSLSDMGRLHNMAVVDLEVLHSPQAS